jgi:predicted transcriptional regulator
MLHEKLLENDPGRLALQSLLSPLVSSGTRVRLLLRFFGNPQASSYLRELASEMGSSTNSVREELNRLSEAQLLTHAKNGREVRYQANQQHPLFSELISIAQKVLGLDQVLDQIIHRLGDLQLALLVDDYAQGRDTGIIDLVLVGHINPKRLNELVATTEGYIKRKIRTLCLTPEEYDRLGPTLGAKPQMVLWQGREA